MLKNRKLPFAVSLSLVFNFILWLSAGSPSAAGELETVLRGLADKSRVTIKKTVVKLGELGDPAALPALEALLHKRLRVDAAGRLIIINEEETAGTDAVSGEAVPIDSAALRAPRINNAVRRVLRPAIARLKLNSGDPDVRLAAAKALMKRPSAAILPLLQKTLKKETDTRVRETLSLVVAQIQLQGDDRDRQLEAFSLIGQFGDNRFKSDLEKFLAKNADGAFMETNPEFRQAAAKAIASIEQRQFFKNQIGNLFYGLSLGSILLLAALGLAITFGLMGVINMAHGEMLMLGAYSTYVVQNLVNTYFPELFNWYLAAAIPTAFVVSALVGIALERLVIRHLYGRPLETLLATWGISLVLIQTVRLIFGAQNVQVANPPFLSGGVELFQGVVLPYNRIVIIIFVICVVGLVSMLLLRTPLGLQVRAVTQNRPMASCMGISAGQIDMWTFGLGSGVAGLGGVALSQIGNVGPELGQFYIVDCFMVVVLGGVGKIAGTVAGAMGLGIVNKFLEPVAGAVLGKIAVLIFIILFIQKRPQGIFALKGRTVEN